MNFNTLLSNQALLNAIEKKGYTNPTPIQSKIIPIIRSGSDVIGQAQTGTGKTAAFALPLLNNLNTKSSETQILVLAPTRELAIQVANAFEAYGEFIPNLNVCLAYGGTGYRDQVRLLKQGAQVVVGTPGRILDHISRGRLDISNLKSFVLDEADEMLKMGFTEDINQIMENIPDNCQTSLFSATMPDQIRRLANKFLKNPTQITISKKHNKNIYQGYWLIEGTNKLDGLCRFLETEDLESVLIFVKTKANTVDLAAQLNSRKLKSACINGDMPQAQREKAINELKSGEIKILIATDVASRGLDIDSVTHVINYDAPYDVESYVHRIGRTGRAGRSGKAILFVSKRDLRIIRRIEESTKSKIEKINLPSFGQVKEKRISNFHNTLLEQINSSNNENYIEVIDSFKKKFPEIEDKQITSALCKLASLENPIFVKEIVTEIEEPSASPERRGRKGRQRERPRGRERRRRFRR